ncbi:hypothetical protein Tco_1560844 [Tanacetum coccineum]
MCIRVRKIIDEGNVLLPPETSSNATSDACSLKSDDENDDYDDESDCELFIKGLNKELENGGGWIREEDEEHIGRNGLSLKFASDGVDYVKSPEYSKIQRKLHGQLSSTVESQRRNMEDDFCGTFVPDTQVLETSKNNHMEKEIEVSDEGDVGVDVATNQSPQI